MVHTEAVDDLPRDDLLAATPEIAARLAGVTVRQVNYWREIGSSSPRLRGGSPLGTRCG